MSTTPLDLMRQVRDSDLGAMEKAVLWAIILRRHNKTGECWASVTTLAGDTGMSRRTVLRHLAALRTAGILKWTHEAGVTNRYIVDLEVLTSVRESLVSESHQCQRVTGVVSESHRSGVTVTPELPRNCSRTDGGEASASNPPMPCKRSSNDDHRTTWALTQDHLAELEAAYPTVDVLAALDDLRRRIETGAQPMRTVRGMPKAVATWVANAAKWGEHPRPRVAERRIEEWT